MKVPDNSRFDVDTAKNGLPTISHVDGVAEFNLLVLGTRGAGKTVFLSALYNQMQDLANGSYFSIGTDPDSRKFLLNKYESVRRPDKDWPPPNAAVLRYTFKAIHTGKSGKYTLFYFHYIDYPGSYVVGESGLAKEFDIQAEVAKTHSLIVLIDGLSVLKRLTDSEDQDAPSIFDDIENMIDLMNMCARRPIQFVVTKMDILRGYSLDKIRDLLFQSRKFKSFVEARREWKLPTHLIGVSAVGDNFAEWDEKAGVMRKRKGATPAPYNLNLTLSFAISDTLLLAFKQQIDAAINRKANIFAILVSMFVGAESLFRYGKWLLDDPWLIKVVSVLEIATKKAKDSTESRNAEIKKIIADVKDFNSAIDGVLEAQQFAVGDYVARSPASNLLSV